MENENVGYKDEKYEQLAKKVRRNLYEMLNPSERDFGNWVDEYYERVDKPSTELAKYLAKTYPDKFKYYQFNYKTPIPELAEYSGPLDEAPEFAKDIWNYTIKYDKYNKDVPKVHDLVVIRTNNIRTIGNRKLMLYGRYVYFIDSDNIYVMVNNGSNSYAPDEFYNFMERMGLIESMKHFIYKGLELEYKKWKWPRKVELTEKII